MAKRKSHMKWSWIIMILFIVLSILDIRFGLLGFACVLTPIIHALRGNGKVHCSHYCPRGSILGKFLSNISFENNMPKTMRKPIIKKILLGLMLFMFSVSLIHAGPNIYKIAFAVFRLMMASLALGVVMGIIYKPRSWCQVCPMGYATGLIRDAKKNKENKKEVV